MNESESLGALPRRWLGTIVIDGRHYPSAIAYASAGGHAATIEIATLPKDAAAAAQRTVSFDVPLATPVGKLLRLIVQAIVDAPTSASVSVSVGALVPAHHDCDALVIEFPVEPRPLDAPRRYAATIRIAGRTQTERIAWTAETSLGEWLSRLDSFCRRGPRRSTAGGHDAAMAPCGHRHDGHEGDLDQSRPLA
jgi:hypothetical protein